MGLALALNARGMRMLLLHPDVVRSRMGGSSTPITTEERVRGMRSLAAGYGRSLSGGFLRFDGPRMR
jgi:hypothetical protein